MSASQTSSAASSVKLPPKAPHRAKAARSASASRSWLQAIVARSVRWRAGASRAPCVRTGRRRSSRSRRRSADIVRRRAAASSIASGRPSRRRQIASATGPSGAGRPIWRGALCQQRHGGRIHQRRNRPLGLELEAQGRPAGGHDHQLVTRPQEAPHQARRLEHLLHVVEHQQQAPLAEEVGERLLGAAAAALPQAERAGHRAGHELGVDHVREVGEEDAAGEARQGVGRHLQRQARLPRAAGAGEGDQAPAVVEQAAHLGQVGVAADEPRSRGRQVGEVALEAARGGNSSRRPSPVSW